MSNQTSPETSLSDTDPLIPKKKKQRPSLKCPDCGFRAYLKEKVEGTRSGRNETWGIYKCHMKHETHRLLTLHVNR